MEQAGEAVEEYRQKVYKNGAAAISVHHAISCQQSMKAQQDIVPKMLNAAARFYLSGNFFEIS